MCRITDGDYCPVTDVYEDDYIVYVRVKKDGECLTVSEFAENLEGDEVVVLFCDGLAKQALRKAILPDKEATVFYEDKVDGEDIIAFRLGETLYDPRTEDEDEDEFWGNDDTYVTVADWCDVKEQEEEKNKETTKEGDDTSAYYKKFGYKK